MKAHCQDCDKELSEEKGEWAHGGLDCHGTPQSEKLFWMRRCIKDLAQALESYDFGPGTIGHDTLKKHEKIIAGVVGENNS